MNKLEVQGVIYTEPKEIVDNNIKRALVCVQVIDEKGFKTTFPAKAWRENAEKLLNLHKGDQVHFIGKITRYKPKNSENWVTDVEITQII